MRKKSEYSKLYIKVYHGYGHKDDLYVCGHVFEGSKPAINKEKDNLLANILHTIRLFFIKPVSGINMGLKWGNQWMTSTTQEDGFYKFEWQSESEVQAGWHTVNVFILDKDGKIIQADEGKIFVPNSTQYGFISDIDDTVLVAHSASTGKRLRVLFTKNPRSRKTFADVVKFYGLLALANTVSGVPNPFFYVSSSEWNLYEDLNEFFKKNDLPKGAFLLSDIKKWYQLFRSGQNKHFGKLIRVVRIMNAFPKQKFILLGDNSQSDVDIYVSIALKYPDRVFAIYIRNISAKKEERANQMLKSIQNNSIHSCLFKHTDEAIRHAQSIGL